MLGKKRTFVLKIGDIIRANFLGRERLVLFIDSKRGVHYQGSLRFVDLESKEIFDTFSNGRLSPDLFYSSARISASNDIMPDVFQIRFLGIEC